MKRATLKLKLNVKKKPQASVPGTDGGGCTVGGIGGANCAVFPIRQDRQVTIFFGNHVADLLSASVVKFVRRSHGRGLL